MRLGEGEGEGEGSLLGTGSLGVSLLFVPREAFLLSLLLKAEGAPEKVKLD